MATNIKNFDVGTGTYIKKVTIGTPIRAVTSGTFSLFNIDGVTATRADVGHHALLIFDSSSEAADGGGFITSTSLDKLQIGNVLYDSTGARNLDDGIFKVQGRLQVSDYTTVAADSDLTSKYFVDNEIEKLKYLVITTDDNFTDSIGIYDQETVRIFGLNTVKTSAQKIGNQYQLKVGLDSTANTALVRSYFSAGGDLAYNESSGVFSINVEAVYATVDFDSDLDAALTNSVNIEYDSSNNSFDLSTTGVDSGTYGTASLVPQFTVDRYGRIDSVGEISVAGVDSTSWDSSTSQFIINTADGGIYRTTINGFGDNQTLTFGDDGDLTIKHDANNFRTVINNAGFGDLRIQSNNVRLMGAAGTETLLHGTTGGSVSVYWDNSKKLETTTYGATVTGTLNADSSTVTNLTADSGTITTLNSTDLVSTNITRTNTTVAAGTYGSASLVPSLTINASGFVDSIGTVAVAGVTSTSYDSATGVFTINTADGGVFTTTIHDSDDRISEIRNAISAAGDLSYNSSTGVFSFDVEQVYTKANFDSDFNTAIDEAALGGTGLTYDDGTNTLNITNTGVTAGTYGSASLVPVLTINAQGQIDSAGTLSVAGVTGFAWDSSTSQATITTADGGSFPATINGFGDNQRLYFGDAKEASIRHTSGGTTVIEAGATELDLDGGGHLLIKNNVGGAKIAEFTPFAGVDLYHGSVKKFATTDSGAYVTGNLTNEGNIRVQGNVLPTADSTYDLGDSNYKWKDLHLSGSTIYLGDVKLQDSGGNFRVTSQTASSSIMKADQFHVDSAVRIAQDGYIEFTPTDYLSAPSRQEGRLWYNEDAKTLYLQGAGSDFDIQIGEREWVRARNNTGSTIEKGKPVYITGVHIPGHPVHGHHPHIALADASDVAKKDVLGIAGEDIAPNNHGYVVIRGYIDGIDTSNLVEGARVHLGFSSPGSLTSAAPEYPNYPMDVGTCLTADSAGAGGALYVTIFDHTFERFRVTGGARVDGNVTIAGNLNVLGTQTVSSTGALSVDDTFIYLGGGDTIGTVGTNFTGSGLNDAEINGHFNGETATSYYVRIKESDGSGNDVIEFALDSDFASIIDFDSNGSGLSSWNLSGDGLTASLRDNQTITFTASSGHTVGDRWYGQASPINVQIGIAGNYNNPSDSYAHSGLFRDVSDQRWKFFTGYQPEPEGNINTSDPTFAFADLQFNTAYGNLTGNVEGEVSTLSNHNTGDLSEGSNLYYTTARHDSDTNILVTKSFVDALNVDADTLDGLNSLQFLRSDLADTASGDITFTGVIDAQNVVTNSTSDLVLKTSSGNTFNLRKDNNSELIQVDNDTGVVELYHNGNKKLETVATGITVTGEVNADSATFTGDIDVGGQFTTVTTDGLTEGSTNLYYTTARVDSDFDASFALASTDSLGEGSTNLYFTEARARASLSALGDLSYDQGTGTFSIDVETIYTKANFDSDLGLANTGQLPEGSNLYYTTARVDSDFDASFALASTDSLGEGSTNLYYTTARFDSDFTDNNTDQLSEGSTNLYYTTARVDSDFDASFALASTDSLGEGATNLYYTTTRFDSDLAATDSLSLNYLDLSKGINRTYSGRDSDTVGPASGIDSSGDSIVNLYVRSGTKTTNHRHYGNGSLNGYFIAWDNASNLNTSLELESPHLDLVPGVTYRFHTDDASMSTHDVRFYYDDERNSLVADSAADIVYSGTAGVSGAYSQIRVKDYGPRSISYQCLNHPYMGNSVVTNATGGSRIWGTSTGIIVDGNIEGTIDGGTY